jgi:hypothetical protein
MMQREYMAFLLRLWREKRDGSWRAALEEPTTAERTGFATLTELVAYLENRTGEKIRLEVAPVNHEESVNSAET